MFFVNVFQPVFHFKGAGGESHDTDTLAIARKKTALGPMLKNFFFVVIAVDKWAE